MVHVLLVEDDATLTASLVRQLGEGGHTVAAAERGDEAVVLCRSTEPDVIVLDRGLPDGDGLDRIDALRAASDAPILVLTAQAASEERVDGLERGADDYLTKPFAPDELVARISALLRLVRRTVATIASDGERPLRRISSGNLLLDPAGHRALLSGDDLALSSVEFMLLHLLVRHPGRAFVRDYLLERLWPEPFDTSRRAVDNVVSRLRRKLGSSGDALESVWGVGYRWRGSA